MSSFPPPSPHSSDDPYGRSGRPGHGQPGDYGQPDDYGQTSSYGQPADEHGGPTSSGGPGPQWEEGPAYGSPAYESPVSAPGPTLPQGAASHGSGPAPVAPAPGTDLASDLGAGLKFAGQAMLRNPLAYLVSALVYSVLIFLIILGAVFAGGMLIVAQTEAAGYADEPTFGEIALVFAVIYGIMLLALPISLLWQSGAARSGVVVLEGGRPSIGQAMIGPMRVILTALLYGVIIFIGSLLLYIPGLIAAVLLFYAVPASARGASPIQALKESFRLATKNLGTTIVAYLVLAVISTVAGMLVITFVVIIPFLILFQLGLYERLSGRKVAEPTRA